MLDFYQTLNIRRQWTHIGSYTEFTFVQKINSSVATLSRRQGCKNLASWKRLAVNISAFYTFLCYMNTCSVSPSATKIGSPAVFLCCPALLCVVPTVEAVVLSRGTGRPEPAQYQQSWAGTRSPPLASTSSKYRWNLFYLAGWAKKEESRPTSSFLSMLAVTNFRFLYFVVLSYLRIPLLKTFSVKSGEIQLGKFCFV